MLQKILWGALLACALLTGCAAPGSRKVGAVLPSVKNIAAAEQMFGPPVETTDLESGKRRSIWRFVRYEQVPGQYAEEKKYIGHDRDGFPVYRTIRYWSPFHHEERACSIEIISNSSGLVESFSQQGNSCDDLLTPEGREKAYAPSAIPEKVIPERKRREMQSPFFGDDIS